MAKVKDGARVVSTKNKPTKKTKPKKASPKKKLYTPFTCDLCSKQFTDKYLLQTHRETHSTAYAYACDQCDFKCKVRKYLSRHKWKRHRDSKTIKCDVCDLMFHFPSGLAKHMLVHTGEKPHKCKECGKAFNTRYSLNTHRLIHTDEKPYQCTRCEYACRDGSTLRKHQAKHAGREPLYRCTDCGKTMKSKWQLKNHVAEKHLNLDVRKHFCSLCDRGFKVKGALNKHVRVVHDKSEGCSCEVCGARVSSRGNLRAHLLRHVPARPYGCPHRGCGKAFKDLSTLRKHEVLHRPDEHYRCEICARLFSRRARLQRHLLQHEAKVKCCECHYCGTQFYNKRYLARHISLKHTGKRQKYICDMCDMETYNKPSIIMHIKYGHGNKLNRVCRVCDKKYRTTKFLRQHYAREHGIYYRTKTKNDPFQIKEEPLDEQMSIDLFEVEKKEVLEDLNPSDAEAQDSYIQNDQGTDPNDSSIQNNPETCAENSSVRQQNESNTNSDFNASNYVPDHITPNDLIRIVHANDNNSPNDESNSRSDKVNLHNDNSNLNNDDLNASNYVPDQIIPNDLNRIVHANDNNSLNDESNSHNEKLHLKNDSSNWNDDENNSLNDDLNSQDLARKIIEENRRLLKKVPEAVFDHHFIQRVDVEKGSAVSDREQKPKPYLLDKKLQEVAKNSLRELLFDVRKRRAAKCMERTRRQYNERVAAALSGGGKKVSENSKIKYFNNNKPVKASKNVRRRDDTTDDDDDDDKSIGDSITNNDTDNELEKLKSRGDWTKKFSNDTRKDDKDEVNDVPSHDKDLSNDVTNNDKQAKPRSPRSKSRSSRRRNDVKNTKNKSNVPTNDVASNDKDHVNDVTKNDDEDSSSDENPATETSDFEDEDEFKRNKSTRGKCKLKFNTHQCYVCFKLFQTKEQLFDHCQHHFDVCSASTLTKCPLCGHVSKSKLSGHLKDVHGITVKLPYTRIQDKRDNKDGSRYYYSIDNSQIDRIEIIPSVKNLNKMAAVNLDKRNRERKDKLVAKAKLVKKGNQWVVEREQIDVNADYMLPELVDEDPKVSDKLIKAGERPSEDYVDRLKKLSRIAKKNGKKMLFPCEHCAKICQTAAALKLHNRKHDPNKKPFKKKIWKHKQKALPPQSTKKPRIVTNTLNREAKPQPIKHKHKCDPELKEFYEKNIRGGDVEFWQFLKIYNKMGRENVTEFADLEKRADFGIHINDTNEHMEANKEIDETNDNSAVTEDGNSEINEVGNVKTDEIVNKTKERAVKTDEIVNRTKERAAKTDEIVNRTKERAAKTDEIVNKTNRSVFKRTIKMSKRDYVRRNEIKNKMRDKIASKHQNEQIASEHQNEQIASEHQNEQIASEHQNEQMASEHQNEQMASEHQNEQMASEHQNEQIASEHQNEQIASEHQNEHIASEHQNELMASEHQNEQMASEHQNEQIASEHQNEQIASEHQNEQIASEHLNEQIASEHQNEQIASEQQNEQIASEHQNEQIASEHQNEQIASEHQNEQIASEHQNEHIASEHQNEQIASEHQNEQIASEHQNEQIASEHQNEHIASEHQNEQIASEHQNEQIASEHQNEQIASEHQNEQIVG